MQNVRHHWLVQTEFLRCSSTQALCETLEEKVYDLKRAVKERDARIRLLEEEVALHKTEVENLRKSLRYKQPPLCVEYLRSKVVLVDLVCTIQWEVCHSLVRSKRKGCGSVGFQSQWHFGALLSKHGQTMEKGGFRYNWTPFLKRNLQGLWGLH